MPSPCHEISLNGHEISRKVVPVADHAGTYESLRDLLLDMARERSLDGLLAMVAARLADRSEIALARIWLLAPGDICAQCRMRPECPDQSRCLHLVASAGQSSVDPTADWSRLDGDFRRFPIGVRKVGEVAARGTLVHIPDVAADARWIVRPEWAAAEGIRSFGGQPLVHQGDVLGVVAVFSREPVDAEGLVWLRMIADHAAVAIANTRAFEEIERLRRQLELENAYLREEVGDAQAFGEIIGGSAALRTVLEQVELVAPTDASVLVLGESGTGKELVAREIHRRSARRDRPLIKVNCASIPRELYESEFFGHVRGAFTGAVKDRVGRFELADGGTLLLDEVGEIPTELQGKLLRVLQEGTYERVGQERTRHVDVRVVAATNRDLKRDVDDGRFRQDLYYRLNVFPIDVIPLRERREDIPLLAAHFVTVAARKLKREAPRLTQGAVVQLQQYDWPGNVRELQNVIERAVITARGGSLRFDVPAAATATVNTARPSAASLASEGVVPDAQLRARERENIEAALAQADGKVYGPGGAAALLGVKPTTLASRMKKLGVVRPPRSG